MAPEDQAQNESSVGVGRFHHYSNCLSVYSDLPVIFDPSPQPLFFLQYPGILWSHLFSPTLDMGYWWG